MGNGVLNWGLLSTARINRAIIPAVRSSARNRLTAVASRNIDSAKAYAERWGIGRALGSYEALLADPEIDVVYISLPNHLHAEWSIKALKAGKHVLCEKPLALTVEQVDQMAAAAKESGRVLAEAFMYRHHAQTLRVNEMVHSGQLGKLWLIKGTFTFTLKREGDIRWNKEAGGGSVWDVGCYPISYARMLTGSEPTEVFGWETVGAGGADLTFVGQLSFPDGVYAQFDASFVLPPRSHMEIVGSDGVLDVPVPYKPKPESTLILRRGDETETIAIQGGDLYTGEVEDMADAALLGKPPRVSLEDSRGTVAAIVALIESAERGEAVRLPD